MADRGRVATLVLLVGAGTAFAALSAIADATIPFGFSVGGNQEPAGKYEILTEDPTTNMLMLRNIEEVRHRGPKRERTTPPRGGRPRTPCCEKG